MYNLLSMSQVQKIIFRWLGKSHPPQKDRSLGGVELRITIYVEMLVFN